MILVKEVTIIDSKSTFHLKKQDILLQNGRIIKIGKNLKDESKQIYQGHDLCISPAWIDIGCQVNDPGHEERESLSQLLKSANKGGYAMIAPFANTKPALDNKTAIDALITKGKGAIYPIGNVSKGQLGEDLTEMYDIHQSKTTIFSDGTKIGMNPGLLMRAMQYTKPFSGKILTFPYSQTFSHGGQMHEGRQSTLLGLKGIPSLAEFSHLQSQLDILEYVQGNLIVFGISTEKSVKLLKSAQTKNLSVESIVPYLNLIYTDEALSGFDSTLKVMPPLRDINDRKALINGVKEKTIKAISSNHAPFDTENKDLEFEYAEFGAAGIETVFSGLFTFSKLTVEEIIEALTYGPAMILGVPMPSIEIGSQGRFTIFDRDIEYLYKPEHPTAVNHPFANKTLKGRIVAVL